MVLVPLKKFLVILFGTVEPILGNHKFLACLVDDLVQKFHAIFESRASVTFVAILCAEKSILVLQASNISIQDIGLELEVLRKAYYVEKQGILFSLEVGNWIGRPWWPGMLII